MLSLEELEPYFDDLDFEPEKGKVDALFEIFKLDFVDEPFELKGIQVSVKTSLSTHNGFPDFFKDYFHIFVHCISTFNVYTNRRRYDHERANRVHWIKPILCNHQDPRIKYYQFMESNRKVRDYYWYAEKSYVVIVEKITEIYWLVTGYCVDDEKKHRKRYQDFIFGK